MVYHQAGALKTLISALYAQRFRFFADSGQIYLSSIPAASGRFLPVADGQQWGQLLPVVRGSRRPDALQGRAIATIRAPLTLESVLHGAEMSSISDMSEYQAINAFDAYQVILQWTSKQGKILDCVYFCVFFPLRMIAPQ